MAILNLNFYKGEDNYSDGDIENDILYMVKNGRYTENDLLNLNSYPVLYHLSHLRENILNWYPFNSEGSVLEIGAGCGAITGLLCDRLKRVVSVDLSKRRSKINFERNSTRDNLEIFVGNFNEMSFDTKFDYIILNGVFEYAISFTDGCQPYEIFLNYIKTFLKPNGIILIAIENRLGLKYFAGAREDHTGRFFSGINDYEDTDFVKTFTKGELINILKVCELTNYKFYYPYPDYKFPNEIFTDYSINSGKYGKKYSVFDAERLQLFLEDRVNSTLANEGIMQYFANSFLIEVGMQGTELSDVIYAKLSNDRNKEYRIATVLEKNNDYEIAVKKALTDESRKHIENLNNNSNSIVNEKIKNLSGVYKDTKITYPLLKNVTVSDKIAHYTQKNEKGKILKLLKKIHSYMFSEMVKTDKYCTEGFKNIFGNESIQTTFNCVKPANIDLICDNIFIGENDQFIIIDTEWVFDILIPSEFIMWRLIHDLYENISELRLVVDKDELFNEFGIDRIWESTFVKWITYFADNYVGNNKMQKCKKASYCANLEILVDNYRKINKLNSTLYYDSGNGFIEKNKINSNVDIKENVFEIYYDLSKLKNIQGLRWDPIENQPCKCKLINVEIDNGGTLIPINHKKSEEGTDLFLTIDPMYVAKGISKDIKYVKIKGKIEYIEPKECVNIFHNEINENNEKIEELLNDNTLTSLKLKQKTKEKEELEYKLKQKTREKEELKERLNEKIQKSEELEWNLNENIKKFEELNNKYNNICNELEKIYSSKRGKVFFRSEKKQSNLRRE